jgi:hypothetical protein
VDVETKVKSHGLSYGKEYEDDEELEKSKEQQAKILFQEISKENSANITVPKLFNFAELQGMLKDFKERSKSSGIDHAQMKFPPTLTAGRSYFRRPPSILYRPQFLFDRPQI